jgi:flagellar hook-basal body complex protein FliE
LFAPSAEGAGPKVPTIVDLKLKPFDFNQALARAGLGPDGQRLTRTSPAAETGGSFRTAMADALKGVSDAQNESTRLQREVALDNPTVSLEETMVAMNKSQLGFQAAVQVRNRLVSAYTDIMNMQV